MNSPYASIALIAVLVVLMYFVILRPQRKRQQQQQQTLTTMQAGTRVMLTSGIFATVSEVGEKQMVVETSPGVELTILKQAISKVVGPADEDQADLNDVQADDEIESAYGQPSTGQPNQPVWPPAAPGPAEDENVWAAGTEASEQGGQQGHQQGNQHVSQNGTVSGGQNLDSPSASYGESSLTSHTFDRTDAESGTDSGTPSTNPSSTQSNTKE